METAHAHLSRNFYGVTPVRGGTTRAKGSCSRMGNGRFVPVAIEEAIVIEEGWP